MKCDIIMPVFNQKEVTQNCIKNIQANTRCPYRLIIVDNGSDEDTKDYLRSLLKHKKERAKKHREAGEVILIENVHNLGPLKVANQGIKVSDAPYICLLNNNVLVTKGWLEEMISAAESDINIGIVNPITVKQYWPKAGRNPRQRRGISPVFLPLEIAKRFQGLSPGNPLDFTRRKQEGGTTSNGANTKKYKWIEIGYAERFCMLIKREVTEKIGLFDEVYEAGPFYNVDYSRRAIASGFLCVRAKTSFVSIREGGVAEDAQDEISKRNKEILYRRWGRPLQIIWVATNLTGERCKKISSLVLELARRGSYIGLFLRGRLPAGSNFPEHASIKIAKLVRFGFLSLSLSSMLSRKKVDIMFIDGLSRESRLLDRRAGIHRVELIYNPDREKVEEMWRKKFQPIVTKPQ